MGIFKRVSKPILTGALVIACRSLTSEPLAKGIQDNSFLIDEAYNQEPGTTVDGSTTALISPGARYAFNLPNDAQLVFGAALPIGLTSDSPDWGVFFYCSFEHPFTRSEAHRAR